MGNLAYELKLLEHWRIHLVFTISQLKLYPDLLKNPFLCLRLELLNSIYIERDSNYVKNYEIEITFMF